MAGGNGDQLWLTQHDGAAGGDDMAVAVTVDAADNVVTTGRSFGTLNLEMATLKLSGASGSLLWLTHYGESLDQFIYATSLVVGSSGDVFVAGVNANEGFAHDYVVLRYDGGNGDELWVATEPGPEADPALPPRIAIGANDDVFLAGSIGPRDDTDFLVQRYAGTTGNLLWSDRFDGVAEGSDQARSLAVDSSGNLLVMGAATGLDGDTEILTLKLAGGSGTEQWRNAFDTDAESDFAFSMALDTAGNAVLAGSSATGSATDFLVAKLDGSTGTTRWNATEGPLDLAVRFGCGHPERASRAMAVDALGNTFVAGCRYNGRNHDILTAKLSPDGQWLWHTVFDGGATDSAVALALDVAGNLIVAGESFDAPTRQDSLVLKYDSGSGALIWSARYTGPTPTSSQSLGDVIVDHNGDVILTGMTSTLGMGFSAANIKFASATGEVLWSTQIDGLSGSMKDVQVDDAGDVYVAGMLGQDLAVAKLSGATGGQIWLARSGDFLGFNGTAKALAIDELGAVAVIGEVFRPQTSADLVTAKLDGMDGSLLWAAYSIGAGNDYDFANAVSVDAAGHVIVLGQHYIAAGDTDLVTIQYDGSNGAVLWERHYDGPGQGTDVALDLALTDTGDAMITGQSQSACAYSQYTTIRYNGLTGDEIWVTRSLPTGMAGGGIRVATDGSARVAGTALLDRDHQIGVVRIDEGGVPDRILRDDFESGMPTLLQCTQ